MYLADWDIDEDVTVRMVEDLGYTALPDNTRRTLDLDLGKLVVTHIILSSSGGRRVCCWSSCSCSSAWPLAFGVFGITFNAHLNSNLHEFLF